MNRLTVREFLDALSHQAELPIVAGGASLEEVVRAAINILRRAGHARIACGDTGFM